MIVRNNFFGAVRALICVVLFISLTLSCVSCAERKVRCSYAELALDLPRSFEPYLAEDTFDAAFYDGVTMVGMLRVSFVAGYDNGIPDTLSPEGFARYYMNKTGKEADIDFVGEVPYFIYYNTEGGTTYFYLATFYRTLYAYFAVTYITEASNEYRNTDSYLEYASSAYMLDVETKENN